jgi:hypothetical protein
VIFAISLYIFIIFRLISVEREAAFPDMGRDCDRWAGFKKEKGLLLITCHRGIRDAGTLEGLERNDAAENGISRPHLIPSVLLLWRIEHTVDEISALRSRHDKQVAYFSFSC